MQKKHLKLKHQAFTLVELIVGLLIGSIFFLTVGLISGIGQSSFENLKKESQTYSDMFNGFELMRNSVHKASSVTIDNSKNPPWLVVDNSAFAIFKPDNKFVYLKDKSNTSAQDVILDQASSLNWTLVTNGALIGVQIQGKKGKESFDLSTSMLRRN